MTVPASDRSSGPYATTGGETLLPYGFKIVNSADLAVYLLRGGGVTRLALTTDYTVDGIGVDAGGNVALKVAALAGDVYLVEGDRARVRTVDFAVQMGFDVSKVNGELDSLEVQIQELRRDFARALVRSRFDARDGDNEMPATTGYLYVGNDGGLTLVTGTPGGGDPGIDVPVTIEQGGTGGTTAAEARDNLELGSLATKSIVAWVDIAAGVVRFDVVSRTVTTPPGSPTAGQMWIVPQGATGAWAGHARAVARWSGSAWQYFVPSGGWSAYEAATEQCLDYAPTLGWQVRATAAGALSTVALDGRIVGFFSGNGQAGAGVRGFWTADNRIFMVGAGSNVGNADPGSANNYMPIQVPWDRTLGIKSVVSGINSHYLIDANDEVWSWGGNVSGQLGHGDTTNRFKPTKIAFFSVSSIKIAQVIPERVNAQNNYTTFFRELAGTGRVWGCGNGGNYVLGNNATGSISTPVQVGSLTSVVEVAFDYLAGPALFRRSNGEVYVTGANGGVGNGLGTAAPAQTPTLVPSIASLGVAKMAVGAGVTGSGPYNNVAVLVCSDGSALVCGRGAYGLGFGSTSDVTTFTPITLQDSELASDVQVLGGAGIVIAFKTTVSTLQLIGYNGNGIRGNGSTSNMTSAVKPAGSFQGSVDEIKLAGPEGNATVAVRVDDVIWTCGYDTTGQTAQGLINTAATAHIWDKVQGLDGNIASWGWCGGYNSGGLTVVQTDGRVKTAGANATGETGTQPGNLHSVSTLQQVMGLPDLIQPAVNWYPVNGTPLTSIGRDGDLAVDTSTGQVWKKTLGVWDGYGSIQGPEGKGYGGTSTTSLAIGTGTKTLTTQAALAYAVGAAVRVSSTASGEGASYWMQGVVSAYDVHSGVMSVVVDQIAGTGTRAAWGINVIGDVTAAATTAAAAATTSAAAAATSQAAASTSATAAAASATAAAGSATAAATSATNAASSASAASTSATNAAASAVAAGSAAVGYSGTSATSLAIPATGTTQTFTTQSGKSWIAGFPVLIYSAANSANYMQGVVASYSGTSLAVLVTGVGGSGTRADWLIQPQSNNIPTVNGRTGAVLTWPETDVQLIGAGENIWYDTAAPEYASKGSGTTRNADGTFTFGAVYDYTVFNATGRLAPGKYCSLAIRVVSGGITGGGNSYVIFKNSGGGTISQTFVSNLVPDQFGYYAAENILIPASTATMEVRVDPDNLGDTLEVAFCAAPYTWAARIKGTSQVPIVPKSLLNGVPYGFSAKGQILSAVPQPNGTLGVWMALCTQLGATVSSTTQSALRELEEAMRINGYLDQILYLMPFVGDATSALVPFVVNGGYTVPGIVSAVTYSEAGGMSAGMIDTGVNPYLTGVGRYGAGLGGYLLNDVASSGTPMITSPAAAYNFNPYFANLMIFDCFASSGGGRIQATIGATSKTKGFCMGNRGPSGLSQVWRNQVLLLEQQGQNGSVPNETMTCNFARGTCGALVITKGLTDDKVVALGWDIERLQRNIGNPRNVTADGL